MGIVESLRAKLAVPLELLKPVLDRYSLKSKSTLLCVARGYAQGN